MEDCTGSITNNNSETLFSCMDTLPDLENFSNYKDKFKASSPYSPYYMITSFLTYPGTSIDSPYYSNQFLDNYNKFSSPPYYPNDQIFINGFDNKSFAPTSTYNEHNNLNVNSIANRACTAEDNGGSINIKNASEICDNAESTQIKEEKNLKAEPNELESHDDKNKQHMDEEDELLDLTNIRIIKQKLSQTTKCGYCDKICYLEETVEYKAKTMCFECLRQIKLDKWRMVRDREYKKVQHAKTRICKHCKAQKNFYRLDLNVSNMTFQYCNHCRMKKAWRNSVNKKNYKKRSIISHIFGEL